MNMHKESTRGGGLASRKLLAALAVLAVALIALTAVSVVASESDATETDKAFQVDAGGEIAYYAETETAAVATAIKDATGDVKITILKDFASTKTDAVISKHIDTEGNVTIDGNGIKLTKLKSPFFGRINTGSFTFVDMTIASSTITGTGSTDSPSTAAFVEQAGRGQTAIKFQSCHIVGSTITGTDYVGGFVGYPIAENSPVSVELVNCSVEDSHIIGNKRAGGFFGQDLSSNVLTSCSISKTEIKVTDDTKSGADWRVGLVASIFNKYSAMETQTVTVQDLSIGAGNTLVQGKYISIAVPEGYKGTEFISCGKCEATLTVDGKTVTDYNTKTSIPYAGGMISVDKEFVVPAGCVLDAEVALVAEGAKLTLEEGAVFNGKLSYTVAGSSGYAEFKNLKAGSSGITIAAGSLTVSGTIDASDSVEITPAGEIKINDVTINTPGTYGGLVIKDAPTGASGSSVTVTGALTVSSGATLTVSSGATLTVANGASVKLECGSKMENNGTVYVASATGSSEAGSIVAEAGSEVFGTEIPELTVETDVELEVAELSGKIKGSYFAATQEVRIVKDTEITSGDLAVAGRLVIPEGVTLTISAGSFLYLTGTAVAEIRGTLVMAGNADGNTATLDMKGYSETVVYGTLVANGAVLAGGQSSLVIEQGAAATIDGSVSGKVRISDSASLTVTGAIAKDASFDVAGTLVVSSDVASGSFTVDIKGSGELDIEKILFTTDVEDLAAAMSLSEFSITVTDDGLVYYDKFDAKVHKKIKDSENGIVITPGSTVTPATGSVYNDAEVTYGATLSGIVVKGAVSVAKVSSADPDNGLYKNYYRHASTLTLTGSMASAAYVLYEGTANSYPSATASLGIEVTGSTTAKTSASVGEASLAAKTTLTLKGAVSIGGAVGITAGAVVSNEGDLTVNAAVDASAKGASAFAKFESSGELTVAEGGSVAVYSATATAVPSDITGTVNAAAYVVNNGTTGAPIYIWNYVTIDAAIAAMNAGTTKAVTLYGEQAVSADATVPESAALTLNAAALTVKKDVTLTLASGAKLLSAGTVSVDVEGTLYVARYSDLAGSVRTAIVSDVYSYATNSKGAQDTSGWAKWTNLSAALAEAKSGETIKIQRNVDLNGTIPAGVTVDANGYTVTVKNDKTLTVAGSISLVKAPSSLVVAAAVTGDSAKAAGSVVLQDDGTIAYTDADSIKLGSATFTIPGAYYTVKGVDTVSTVANAAVVISGVDEQKVEIRQDASITTALALGNISFAGKSAADAAEITVSCAITGTVSLSNATLTVSASRVDATFASADGSVAVAGDARNLKAAHGTYGSGDKAVSILQISGTLSDYTLDPNTVKATATFSGKAYIVGQLKMSDTTANYISGALTVSESSDVCLVATIGDVPASGDLDVAKLVVAGNMTVLSGNVDVVTSTAVSGALAVQAGTVKLAETTVSGSIDASKLNDSSKYAGSVEISKLYLGTTSDIIKTTAADASVAGNVKITGSAIVSAGAAVPKGWSAEDDALSGDSKALNLKSTKFIGEDGGEYITAYAINNATLLIDDIRKSVTDADFEGWTNSKGEIAAQTDDDTATLKKVKAYVGSPDWTFVNAKIDKNVFEIRITTDGGIGRVTLNGVLMKGEDNTFDKDKLVAGSYTVEFAAAAGYDASKVVLTDMDGNVLNTKTILINDETTKDSDPERTLMFQLVGSEVAVSGGSSSGGMSHDDAQGIIDAIDKNTDAVKNQPTGAAADNSLTNILLIVLVVLIVIMAALVAMRMMRS